MASKKSQKNVLKKLLHRIRRELFLIFVALATFAIFIPVFTYIFFAKDLSTTTAIMNRNSTGVILYDRNGTEFFKFYEAKYKKSVPLTMLPKHVKDAVIVAEDREFYRHPGFSIKAIIGAVIADIKERDLAYGGSTITQQLVKSSLLKPEKDFLRKYQEIILAQEIERRYTKDQILEMYLNSVYFGEGAFGIEAASLTYFGKPAKDLNLSEASMLAGLLTAPSSLSPLSGDEELARKRQQYVLNELKEERLISENEYKNALNTKLTYTSEGTGFPYKAPHFALMVKAALDDEYGEEQIARSGFKIYTTLDLSLQEYAENEVKKQVENLKASNVTNGAATVIDPKTGEVLVVVGSHDWFDDTNGKVNMATTPRQPGSSFKPIIYADALEKRIISPASVLKDQPTTFQKTYKPENYDKKFRGQVLVRRSLANSLNVPSVEIMQKLGVEEGLEYAKKLGITTLEDPSQYGLSLVLGSGEVPLIEMTNAYATFANGGQKNPITMIKKIEDKRGKTVYSYTPRPEPVIEKGAAFLISSILSDSPARREVFGTALDTPGIQAAVKTGTSENYRDSLTLGYTPEVAVGVWVGNNDNKAMEKVAGSLGAAPIWKAIITKFHQTTKPSRFVPPEGVVQLSICKTNGLLAKTATSAATAEFFLDGTQPTRICTWNTAPRRQASEQVNGVSDQDSIRRRVREAAERVQNENKEIKDADEIIKEVEENMKKDKEDKKD
jgi:1A family penicillin-binding protein